MKSLEYLNFNITMITSYYWWLFPFPKYLLILRLIRLKQFDQGEIKYYRVVQVTENKAMELLLMIDWQQHIVDSNRTILWSIELRKQWDSGVHSGYNKCVSNKSAHWYKRYLSSWDLRWSKRSLGHAIDYDVYAWSDITKKYLYNLIKLGGQMPKLPNI